MSSTNTIPDITASSQGQAVKGASKLSAAAAAAATTTTTDFSASSSSSPPPSKEKTKKVDYFPRSPSFSKEQISPQKCSQLSPAKKLPSPTSTRKFSVTVPARIYDISPGSSPQQQQQQKQQQKQKQSGVLRRVEARIEGGSNNNKNTNKSFGERAKGQGEEREL